MPCSIIMSMTLQNEIQSIVTSDFQKKMTILKSFNSVFYVLFTLLSIFDWNDTSCVYF